MMQHELVSRAQAGDHEAFAVIAAQVIGRLHTTARLILRDADRADDAVQDALMAAWLDIRSIRDPDRLDAWLHRLLVRACFKVARRTRRHRVSEVPLLPGDSPVVPDGAGTLALRDQLERGFRQLTPEQRAVLVLHHYLGLPDDAAAEMLGIPTGTLKSRLNRATHAMRAALEADERLVGLPRRTTA